MPALRQHHKSLVMTKKITPDEAKIPYFLYVSDEVSPAYTMPGFVYVLLPHIRNDQACQYKIKCYAHNQNNL